MATEEFSPLELILMAAMLDYWMGLPIGSTLLWALADDH